MNSGSKIKFIQPMTWKAVDENKVDEYLRVFVNPHAEWFEEVGLSQVGSMFLPVYFLDWLQSQLLHGTFHKEASVYAVFAVEAIQPPGGNLEEREMIVKIVSEHTPFGRTTSLKIEAIDFSALLYEHKFIYSWGHKTLFAEKAKEYHRCLNAAGESLWVEMGNVLMQKDNRPVLFSTAFYPVDWSMLEHVVQSFERSLSAYRRVGPMPTGEQSYRSLLSLIQFKRKENHRSVVAMNECFPFWDLVLRTYRVAISECGPEDGDIFIGREWLRIIDGLNTRLFNRLHAMQNAQQPQEVTNEES